MPLYNPSQSAALYEPSPATVPIVANFAWVNQGTATATTVGNGVLLVNDNDGEIHALVQAAPAAPYDVYMRMEFDLYTPGAVTLALDSLCGIVLRDSASGRLLECGLNLGRQATTLSPLYSTRIGRWNSPTSASTEPANLREVKPVKWLRVNVTTTTVTFYVSQDGRNWFTIGTDTIASFMVTIDQIGITIRGGTSNGNTIAFVQQFGTAAPV